MRDELPTGTVTFLFTDIEGSTKLLQELGAEGYAAALAEHRRVLREAMARHGGVEVDTQGDAFFVAFPTAPGAVAAADEAQAALASGPIRVRMGLHTGTPLLGPEGYVGPDVHRAARIAAAGHGGQVLLSTSTVSLTGSDGVRDLGAHRLKDLSAPERIYQLGEADFPPLKSLHQTNLPIPLTPFLGREREVAEVVALVSRGDVRLLTLTGPGGTGKTRLASQSAAAAAGSFEDGVWWVPLAPLRDPELVLSTAAQAIGVRGGLANAIADQAMLLLFDNFEQVVSAAPDIGDLLQRCPRLTVLATSRERLRLTGEREYPVPPFAHQEAVEFFVARARAVEPDFEADRAVAEICRRLDDLPLALELAAARTKFLTPVQILARLSDRLALLTGGARDAPERQRTLEAAIAWSYELMTDGEQRLFARLSVFRGGCSLEAAEAVAGADLETLGSLVDKSLVRRRGDRFAMLETIRAFAGTRLEASGATEEVRRRHARYFTAMAQEAEPNLLEGNFGTWLDQLERDHDNLRGVLDWLEGSGAIDEALALSGALSRFWYLRGHLAEGTRRLEPALRAGDHAAAGRAKALSGLALLGLDSGNPRAMKRYAEEALAIYRLLGDARGAAYSSQHLGHATVDEGDLVGGRRLLEEATQAFRDLGDTYPALMSAHGVAFVDRELGDLPRSLALHEENLRLARASGIKRMEARSLAQLALIAVDQGQIQSAIAMLTEAYEIDHKVGESVEIALDLCRLARALAFQGNAEAAIRLLASAETLRMELGATFRPWAIRMNDETRTTIHDKLDQATFDRAWAEGLALSADEAVKLALAEATAQPSPA